MAHTQRYAKPSMTNLPKDLGKSIFRQIMNTPKPDRERMRAESAELLRQMVKERDREDAQGNPAE